VLVLVIEQWNYGDRWNDNNGGGSDNNGGGGRASKVMVE
jgi:hypothetical protein